MEYLFIRSGRNTVDRSNGQTLLHKAASNGDADMVDLLLANGLDPNQQDSNGRCPLHWACVCGHDTIVEMLLSNGANAQLEDNNNATSFQLARNEGHAKVLLTLSTRHLLKHWSRLQEPPPCEEGLVNIPSANGDMVIRNEEQLKAVEERLTRKFDDEVRELSRAFDESRGANPTTRDTTWMRDVMTEAVVAANNASLLERNRDLLLVVALPTLDMYLPLSNI
mgnify:CR=1 FL=1